MLNLDPSCCLRDPLGFHRSRTARRGSPKLHHHSVHERRQVAVLGPKLIERVRGEVVLDHGGSTRLGRDGPHVLGSHLVGSRGRRLARRVHVLVRARRLEDRLDLLAQRPDEREQYVLDAVVAQLGQTWDRKKKKKKRITKIIIIYAFVATDYRYASRKSQMSCFASLNSWFVTSNRQSRKLLIQGFICTTKFYFQVPPLLQVKVAQQGRTNGSWFSHRKFAYHSVKLIFFWHSVTGITSRFFSGKALYPFNTWLYSNYDLFFCSLWLKTPLQTKRKLRHLSHSALIREKNPTPAYSWTIPKALDTFSSLGYWLVKCKWNSGQHFQKFHNVSLPLGRSILFWHVPQDGSRNGDSPRLRIRGT